MMRHGGKQLCDIIGLKLKPNTHRGPKRDIAVKFSGLDVIKLAFWRQG